ncbi:MAG TPA: ABC transporter ATP-binding protein [Candidatus Dormibacteraeota bacterium]|nr:ABC transporter ATP-binding protein [Candidatus Dormibacteraeota bacterium]
MPDSAVRIDHLSKRFRVYHQRNTTLKQSLIDRRRGRFEEFWAVRDVSVEVPVGASLGIIGENGSGKSTLLKCVAGILVQDKGEIAVIGRLASLLEVGAGFHPDFTGRENIYLNGAILGLPRRYITSILDTIVEFAELEQFIDNPVKTYSSGMYTRLGFAIAVNLDPDILLVDEVLAVGDEAFQRRCMERINAIRAEGRTLVFVSHALESVRSVCDRCLWMDHGVARMTGGVDAVISAYLTEVNRREAKELEVTDTAAIDTSPGRAGVRITSIEVAGPDGPGTVLNTGDPLTLSVGYEAPGPLSGCRFSVTFLRPDGAPILTVSTDDLETGDGALPRRGDVRLALPGVPFLEGVYRVTVDLTEISTGQHFKRLERVRPFRVHSADRHEVGMALLGHEWELPKVTSRAARS